MFCTPPARGVQACAAGASTRAASATERRGAWPRCHVFDAQAVHVSFRAQAASADASVRCLLPARARAARRAAAAATQADQPADAGGDRRSGPCGEPRRDAPRPGRTRERSTRAVQDAAAAPFGGGAVLLGGLTAADISSRRDRHRDARGLATRRAHPAALHDAAAVTIGRSAYVFGGGNGVAAARHDPAGRPAHRRRAGGRPPAAPAARTRPARPSAGTAYIVGGYTGTRWLDTIVAWQPGRHARASSRTCRTRFATRRSLRPADGS